MTTTRPRYLLLRAGVDRYADALNPFNRLSWPVRLRLALMVPWRSGWNRRVRDWTARREGYASYEDETTRPAFTVAYNDIGSPRPERVCDCWLLPSLPPHRSECGYYTPPVMVPTSDHRERLLARLVRDLVEAGCHSSTDNRCAACDELILTASDVHADGCPWRHAADWLERYDNDAQEDT